MRYFVADLHLGHKKVSDLRYPEWAGQELSTQVMDNVIISQMCKLTSGDQLWILGDISGGKEEEYALNTLADIKEHTGVQLHLIAGNHDSVSSIHRDAWKRQSRFLEVFDSVQQFARLRFGQNNVLLSHFPYKNLGDGPNRGDRSRYNEFRLPDEGFPLIHGHTHQTTPHVTLQVKNYRQHGDVEPIEIKNQYCVSWDVHRNLVREDIIQDWLLSWNNEQVLKEFYF